MKHWFANLKLMIQRREKKVQVLVLMIGIKVEFKIRINGKIILCNFGSSSEIFNCFKLRNHF